MDQERAMMIFLSYQNYECQHLVFGNDVQKNPLRERLLVRKFIAQLET